MKRILTFIMFVTLVTLSNSVYCQEKAPDPMILSIMPDSVFVHYEYSQAVFVVGSSASSFKLSGSPTEKAIEDMKKQIIAICKQNKMDYFVINQLVFAKPADFAEVIGYGTMIRKKAKTQK